MRKRRLLWVGEASYLNTGYSTYGQEILDRLHESDKYELAELASYGDTSDPRDTRWRNVPWTFFPAMPDRRNEEEVREYQSEPINQFGAWKFEESCLKFRPDIVCSMRDFWMDEFIERSPLRQFYYWCHMATVDAKPQDEQWISTYLNADALFTYSDWAFDVLREQGGGQIKLKCSTPPGADLETFVPKSDRRAHRRAMGIDEDCFIVGAIMRNQRRKLFPDLIQAFAEFLKTAPESLAKKTFLYLHTSWPDVGWDIPRLILEAGISSKCVFTYICRNCRGVFPSFFQDAKSVCQRCGQSTAVLPSSSNGISRKVLGDIINLFDAYVGYANSEGFGMPLVEAAACGVPVFAVDYSAMSDVVRKLKGFPIKVQRYYRESETHCWRALPDNTDFVVKLIKFLSVPESVRARHAYEARKAVEEHYTYERTAKIWMDHFDSIELRPRSETWESPPRLHTPERNVPAHLSNEEFVRWGLCNVAGRPEFVNHYMSLRMIRDLNWGQTLPGAGGLYFNEASMLGSQQRHQPFDRERCLEEMNKLCQLRNHWERRRTGR